MNKRYRYANSIEGDYSQKRIDNDYFHGYVCYIKIKNIKEPFIVNNGMCDICIIDDNYEWLEVYPDNANYAITIMFDDNHKLIEWYFDIAKTVGLENGVPFEDDLYLDMAIMPDGQKLILDEDELLNAFKNGEITKDDVNLAYQTLHDLEMKYANNLIALKNLTNLFYKIFRN